MAAVGDPVIVGRVVYSEEQIGERVRQLASAIREDLNGERPLLISVLKGSVIFLADLVRSLGIDPDIDFMSITSYPGEQERTGVVRIVKDLEEPIESRHVIVVEDIIDTGLTLSYLLRTLQNRDPRSLRVCVLVDKPVRRITPFPIDYIGFQTEEFLIGYGLDFRGHYRNLPHLVAIEDVAELASNPQALKGRLFGGEIQ